MLKRLTSTLVVDHVGKFLEPIPLDHPGFRTLLNLLEGGRTWVKLSAPYEVSKVGPPHYDDVGKLAKVLAEDGARANAMGVQLAASNPERNNSGRCLDARYASGLGSGRTRA